MTVRFRFAGLEGWEDHDASVPRVPVLGERVVGPGDFGAWVVQDVSFDYVDGFAVEPGVVLTLVRLV